MRWFVIALVVIATLPAEEAAPGAPLSPPPSALEIAAITYDDCADDNDLVTPFAKNYDNMADSQERKKDWDDFLAKLDVWAPGKIPDVAQRVRNLLSVCAIMDVGEGQFESETPLAVYQGLKHDIDKDKLLAVLAGIVLHPEEGAVFTSISEVDLASGVAENLVRERLSLYAKKMLGRVLGKLPIAQQ